MIGFIIVAFMIIAVFAIIFGVQHSRRVDEAWQQAGARLGLAHRPGGVFRSRELTGRLQHCRVHVDTYTESHGKSSTTYTRFKVFYPRPLGIGLRLTPQGFFSGIGKFFGAQDIEVGDRGFDDDVIVKGADPRAVVEFLTPPRRVRILRLMQNFEGVRIEDDRLEWSTTGVLNAAAVLVSRVRNLVTSAEALAGETHDDAAFDKALAARESGDLDEALERAKEARLHRHEIAPPALPSGPLEPVEESVMEGELLYLGGRHEEARKVFEELEQAAPEDEEIHAWAEQARKAAQEESPAVAQDAEVALDVESVCKALFVDVSSSSDANRIFEERYQGRTVTWEGKLDKARAFTYDFVLGGSGGTKAHFEIYELPGGFVGSNSVTAIVGLPEGLEEKLAPLAGRTLAFSGTLVRADSFMRNLFLTQGSCQG